MEQKYLDPEVYPRHYMAYFKMKGSHTSPYHIIT